MSILANVFSVLSWVCLLAGCCFLLIGTIGLLRLPDLFTRMHAVAIVDTLGTILIVAGLILQSGFTLVSIKLLLIVFFILFTSPTSTHALAKAALHGNLKPLLSNQRD